MVLTFQCCDDPPCSIMVMVVVAGKWIDYMDLAKGFFTKAHFNALSIIILCLSHNIIFRSCC